MKTELQKLKKVNGGARPGAGRKPFMPTDDERRQVEELSGHGLPHDNIAAIVRDGIDDLTLKKHFVVELKRGKAKANSRIGKTLFEKAIGGDTTAMIWWSKTQMRWTETQKHILSGDSENPIAITEVRRVIVYPKQ